jgi:hypothetical protein
VALASGVLPLFAAPERPFNHSWLTMATHLRTWQRTSRSRDCEAAAGAPAVLMTLWPRVSMASPLARARAPPHIRAQNRQ